MDDAKYATNYNATKWYISYANLVQNKNVDIIYIATPHPFYFLQTLVCLQNNKAVLLDKSMSLSLQETTEMIDMAQTNNFFLLKVGGQPVCLLLIKLFHLQQKK